ncbi:hypothetical protein NX773_13475 [Massilia solisilvae]|uniref:Uncharacterized protein n=1 Tax=Massilia solisilvae TaxID=1811225 RepID=A0ABT2BKY9_9BURK|nr:DUF6587 family protein [Massilia solisilvae]MCS0609177.1 hypothetical protein [Massilia solisilvae]
MVQQLIVAVIVLVAAAFAARKYMPAALKRRIVYLLNGRGTRQSRLARWFDTDAGCGSSSGSGSDCSSCHACDTSEPAPPAGKHRVIKLHVDR